MPSSPPSSLTFVPTSTIRSEAWRAGSCCRKTPKTLRATWDLAGAMAASQATPPPFAFVVHALVLAVVALAVGALVVTKVGYLL